MNSKYYILYSPFFFIILLSTFFLLFPNSAYAANRYWVDGTGNWADDANHWATETGGTPEIGNKPGVSDTAIFDSNSNGGTAMLDEIVSIAVFDMQTGNTTAVDTSSASNYALSTSGKFIITAGTFNANGSTITVGGDWDSSGGTFNYYTSTIVMTGASNTITTPPNSNWWTRKFNNLSIDTGATITVQTAASANGFQVANLTISGELSIPSGKILQVANGTLIINNGGVLSGAGTLSRSISNNSVPHITNNGTISVGTFSYLLYGITGGAVTATTYGGNLQIRDSLAGTTAGVLSAGSLIVNGSLIVQNDSVGAITTLDNSINNADITVNNLKVGSSGLTNKYAKFITGSANITINGDVTIYASDASGTNEIDARDSLSFNITGNFTNNDTFIPGVAAAAPIATTNSTINITSTSATLTGLVNANDLPTKVWFEYDIQSGLYTNQSISQTIAGSSDTLMTIDVYGFPQERAGTTYYYRIIAQNELGTVYGSEMIFTTLGANLGDENWKNWYGIVWNDSSANHCRYAKQMGYDYIGVTHWKFDEYKALNECAGLNFYFIDIAPYVYNIGSYANDDNGGIHYLDTSKSYTQTEIDHFNQYKVWKSNDPFPNNIATGWSNICSNKNYSISSFATIWDYQQQSVIDYVVDRVINVAKDLDDPTRPFNFTGYIVDVPLLTGDFYTLNQGNNVCLRATLSDWTGSDSGVLRSGITHEYATYSDGKAAFYKQLNLRMRQEFPTNNTKWIVEPYYIYNENGKDEWIYQIKNRLDKDELIPDMLMQEGSGTEFVDDPNNFIAEVGITKNIVGISQPNSVGEYENRLYAAKAGINRAWYNWFGRFGGTGDMPSFSSVTEVYPRLQLIRAIPNWDNLNDVPLNGRSWDGNIYQSIYNGGIQSYISADVMYSRHWKNGKLFAVFNTHDGVINLKPGEIVTGISKVNGFFEELEDGSDDIIINNNQVILNPSVIIPVDSSNNEVKGVGYVFTFNQITNISIPVMPPIATGGGGGSSTSLTSTATTTATSTPEISSDIATSTPQETIQGSTLDTTYSFSTAPGSSGYETGYFGILTQRAVERFQIKYNIVTSGTPETTGFGRVGPSTIAKLVEIFGL